MSRKLSDYDRTIRELDRRRQRQLKRLRLHYQRRLYEIENEYQQRYYEASAREAARIRDSK